MCIFWYSHFLLVVSLFVVYTLSFKVSNFFLNLSFLCIFTFTLLSSSLLGVLFFWLEIQQGIHLIIIFELLLCGSITFFSILSSCINQLLNFLVAESLITYQEKGISPFQFECHLLELKPPETVVGNWDPFGLEKYFFIAQNFRADQEFKLDRFNIANGQGLITCNCGLIFIEILMIIYYTSTFVLKIVNPVEPLLYKLHPAFA